MLALMRVVDAEHLGNQRVIGAWEHEGVVIDPGPESTLETVLAGMGEGWEPRAILLTHIHFDHAGASGAILRRWPDVPVYVHEVGAPHVINPERLVKSATRLYGDDMDRLWGEVVPIPEANVNVLTGGETVLGEYRVEYTPGHASHHVSYLHEPTGTAFCGDTAGIRIPPTSVVFAPTPPPDIDVEAWNRSIDLLEGWSPERLAITHYGEITEDIPGHLGTLRESLDRMLDQVSRLSLEDFVAQHVAWLEERVGVDTATEFQQAGPPDQLWQGLNRYLDKQKAA
jgi:glyoxylase-like metal-dependent hydrolase (beta-lactamase superfamily II)